MRVIFEMSRGGKNDVESLLMVTNHMLGVLKRRYHFRLLELGHGLILVLVGAWRHRACTLSHFIKIVVIKTIRVSVIHQLFSLVGGQNWVLNVTSIQAKVRCEALTDSA